MARTSFPEIGDAEWEFLVDRAEGLVAVKFFRDDCSACGAMSPYHEAIKGDYEHAVKFYQLDTKKNGFNVARYYPESRLPCLSFFYKGELIGDVLGAMKPEHYNQDLHRIFEKYAEKTRTTRIFRKG